MVSSFHLLLALTYFVAFPLTQNFLANAASIDPASIDNSTFLLVINFFILMASIGFALMFNLFVKQLVPKQAEIKISPLVLDREDLRPITASDHTISTYNVQLTEKPKKKIIIQF
ncbi:MAG: hypothetical protein UT18_C0017G0001 [candidate division CPR2 bacterium GW2011_GWC2_39_10]|uniref:Uncharacterized protein n=1 Tax=candidate division CPR2 bacterium GW2011_GWC2_39_10 TaxID=1618345 RepID=A0A0G0PWE8_UNCC2|nr:MAG: hypothetical protein UT18_C0017G0001 [candidate division CPR2 bacterium GW2011_GWC2_39_10]